ncbi:MAG TPA: ABC-2 family transporter protein [Polyangia bacterium]|nr:ABC-2 family transporter protein [Polyangia bacterium]
MAGTASAAPPELSSTLVGTLSRYTRLLRLQFRMSGITAMQYRADFIVRGLLALMWIGVTLLPFAVVFGGRASIAGWSFAEALVVVAWFTLLKAFLEGAVSPSLTAVVEHVRKGTLDFVLLKPADAQFLVSTAKFEPWRVIDFIGALMIFVYAFHLLGRWPTLSAVALALVFLVVAVFILYSIWILVVSAAFWVVKVDNLSYLFGSAFDVARWPVTIFKGTLRFVFTFVFPLAVMTTYPAEALLGRLSAHTAVLAIAGGVVFAAIARRVWLRALRLYTSASS